MVSIMDLWIYGFMDMFIILLVLRISMSDSIISFMIFYEQHIKNKTVAQISLQRLSQVLVIFKNTMGMVGFIPRPPLCTETKHITEFRQSKEGCLALIEHAYMTYRFDYGVTDLYNETIRNSKGDFIMNDSQLLTDMFNTTSSISTSSISTSTLKQEQEQYENGFVDINLE